MEEGTLDSDEDDGDMEEEIEEEESDDENLHNFWNLQNHINFLY